MPSVQVVTPPTAQQEPVSLALLNAALRLDLDPALLLAADANTVPADADPALVAQVALLALLRSAAREKVESYTQRFYAGQTVALTFGVYEPYDLPEGGTATAVTGFFTTVAQLADRYAYLVEYQKGISINRQVGLAEALALTYTVTVVLAKAFVPALVQSAILELAGEWFRNRETTVAGVRSITELPVNYRVKLAHLVQYPLSNY